MSVRAISEYEFEPSDGEAKFHGARIVYAGWNGHMMFASPYAWPLAPDMVFGDFLAGPLGDAFGSHPDWAQIDWGKAVWTRNDEPFSPDCAATIADNGIIHKDALRFTTPGLDGLGGMGI